MLDDTPGIIQARSWYNPLGQMISRGIIQAWPGDTLIHLHLNVKV